MERIPTARSDLLRARKAMTLRFLGHKNETFFRWSLRLGFATAALQLPILLHTAAAFHSNQPFRKMHLKLFLIPGESALNLCLAKTSFVRLDK